MEGMGQPGRRRASGEGPLPNASIRVVPVLASHVEHLLPIKASWPKRSDEDNAKTVDDRTYSLSGAMADTT